MKLLPSTILASYLASTALVGSAAEMEELPAVRGLRGTAKLPKVRGHRSPPSSPLTFLNYCSFR